MTSRSIRDAYDRAVLLAAREAISAQMLVWSAQAKRELGFGWIATADAPSTYSDLQLAFKISETTGAPLPVSSEHCQDVIYIAPEMNQAFRYWHDTRHIMTGLTFDLDDELELALLHLVQLEEAGFGPGSTPWRLLQADLIGPVMNLALTSKYPRNQRRFGEVCLEHGFHSGLLTEIRQSQEAGR